MTLLRLILVVLGCLCLALGTLGAFLPVLPTVRMTALWPGARELRVISKASSICLVKQTN